MGSQCQTPSQGLAEGSGFLGHFPPPTAFCAALWGPATGVTQLSPSSWAGTQVGCPSACPWPEERGEPQPDTQSSDTGAGVDAAGGLRVTGYSCCWGCRVPPALQGRCGSVALDVTGLLLVEVPSAVCQGKRCSVPLWHHQPQQRPASTTSTSS